MASAGLRTELECSICLNIYTDPVTLKCGHNFCRLCIDRVLDKQKRSGDYSCPQCRKRFKTRPVLQRNTTLHNIAQRYPEEFGVFCTHCVDSHVPAVRSCLHCEAYLCDKHLRAHSKASDHVLCHPSTCLQIRKCSTHKELFKFYCINDGICVCLSCNLAGKHKGHEMESLDKASKKKKEKLRKVKKKLLTKRDEMEERVQNLKEHRKKVEHKAAGDKERVTALFTDLRRRLKDLENRVLREISKQAERISNISKMIKQLETKRGELSGKMRHIEKLCNMKDPLTVLRQTDTDDSCDTEDGDVRERYDRLLCDDGQDLDVAGILNTRLSDIIKNVNVYFPLQEAADILMDVNTAHNNLHISDDRKTVSKLDTNQNRPEKPERFNDCSQVLSSQNFSSGRHYWEVDVGRSDIWRVGMCYPSINRKGLEASIGRNNRSWGLLKSSKQFSIRHDNKETPLSTNPSSNRVRIFVDYEAGRISFYELCDPIRHLYTFTTTFTEPLHAVLCLVSGCLKICEGNREIWKVRPQTDDVTRRRKGIESLQR